MSPAAPVRAFRSPVVSIAERALAPLLRRLPPETAHALALGALESGVPLPAHPPPPELATTFAGIALPSPLGLAAGFDKDARAPDALGRIGFGHVEVGTVTPRPQPGNPRPRVFRLVRERALVNRLGFPSAGHERVAARLARRPADGTALGVNVGPNAGAADPTADICRGILRLGAFADYVCVNVSSPNTPGLRELQTGDALGELLLRAGEARREAEDRRGRPLPLALKVAPDLDDGDLPGIAERVAERGVDALAVANTTVRRPPSLAGRRAGEPGGLSGPPLMAASTRLLARFRLLLPDAVALVGIGGVAGAEDAWRKIEAGATLVQLYTAFAYRGTRVVGEIHRGLARRLAERGLASPADATGVRAEEIAGTPA